MCQLQDKLFQLIEQHEDKYLVNVIVKSINYDPVRKSTKVWIYCEDKNIVSSIALKMINWQNKHPQVVAQHGYIEIEEGCENE